MILRRSHAFAVFLSLSAVGISAKQQSLRGGTTIDQGDGVLLLDSTSTGDTDLLLRIQLKQQLQQHQHEHAVNQHVSIHEQQNQRRVQFGTFANPAPTLAVFGGSFGGDPYGSVGQSSSSFGSSNAVPSNQAALANTAYSGFGGSNSIDNIVELANSPQLAQPETIATNFDRTVAESSSIRTSDGETSNISNDPGQGTNSTAFSGAEIDVISGSVDGTSIGEGNATGTSESFAQAADDAPAGTTTTFIGGVPGQSNPDNPDGGPTPNTSGNEAAITVTGTGPNGSITVAIEGNNTGDVITSANQAPQTQAPQAADENVAVITVTGNGADGSLTVSVKGNNKGDAITSENLEEVQEFLEDIPGFEQFIESLRPELFDFNDFVDEFSQQTGIDPATFVTLGCSAARRRRTRQLQDEFADMAERGRGSTSADDGDEVAVLNLDLNTVVTAVEGSISMEDEAVEGSIRLEDVEGEAGPAEVSLSTAVVDAPAMEDASTTSDGYATLTKKVAEDDARENRLVEYTAEDETVASPDMDAAAEGDTPLADTPAEDEPLQRAEETVDTADIPSNIFNREDEYIGIQVPATGEETVAAVSDNTVEEPQEERPLGTIEEEQPQCAFNSFGDEGVFVCRTLYQPVTGEPTIQTVCCNPDRALDTDKCGCCDGSCPDGNVRPDIEFAEFIETLEQVEFIQKFNEEAGLDLAEFVPLGCLPDPDDPVCARNSNGDIGSWVCRTIYSPFTGQPSVQTVCVDPEIALTSDQCGCCGGNCPVTPCRCPCDITDKRDGAGIRIMVGDDENSTERCMSPENAVRFTTRYGSFSCIDQC